MEKDNTSPFNLLDKLELDQNIDRIIPFARTGGEQAFLTTSYHLDKEKGIKYGQINIVRVNGDKDDGGECDKLEKVWTSESFENCGFLSVKHE